MARVKESIEDWWMIRVGYHGGGAECAGVEGHILGKVGRRCFGVVHNADIQRI